MREELRVQRGVSRPFTIARGHATPAIRTAPVWNDSFGVDDLERFMRKPNTLKLLFRFTCTIPFCGELVFVFALAT